MKFGGQLDGGTGQQPGFRLQLMQDVGLLFRKVVSFVVNDDERTTCLTIVSVDEALPHGLSALAVLCCPVNL